MRGYVQEDAHADSRCHPDVEFILLTGDYPPHDIWTQTEETNLDHAKAVVDAIIVHDDIEILFVVNTLLHS